METVDCPRGDNGLCTIPPRTAMITADELTPISRKKLMARYPDLDLATAEVARVDAEPGEVVDVLRSPQHPKAKPVYAAVRAAFARTPGSTAVIVTCTCGHTYVLDAA